MTSWRDKRWPLLGHRPGFQADATGFLLRIARDQGDVAHFWLGRTQAVLLSHPDHVRQVLIDRADDFTKGRLMQRARRLLGNGLLTSEGDLHRSQRRRIQPVFTREHLHSYASLVPAITASLTAGWRDGQVIRLDAEMNSLAMKLVVRALLGIEIEEEALTLGRPLGRLSYWAPLLAAPGGRLLERIRLPGLGRLADAIDIVEEIIHRYIERGDIQRALLGALLEPEDQPISHQLVRDEVMTMFLAGHDTTSAALTSIWLLLAQHAEVEERLPAELASVLGFRDPKPEDLGNLPYTDAVVRETLRLYPPVGRIGRRPLRDIELNGTVI